MILKTNTGYELSLKIISNRLMILRSLYIVLLKMMRLLMWNFQTIYSIGNQIIREITALISSVIPFEILHKCIAEQWTSADKIGNSFVVDSRIFKIYCNFVCWISIDYDN